MNGKATMLSGTIFTLNCYWHELLISVLRPAEICHITTSREGVKQGDPLLMVIYGLALLYLYKAIRAADSGVLVNLTVRVNPTKT